MLRRSRCAPFIGETSPYLPLASKLRPKLLLCERSRCVLFTGEKSPQFTNNKQSTANKVVFFKLDKVFNVFNFTRRLKHIILI